MAAGPAATVPAKKVLDVYDEEFATNLELAKNLIDSLPLQRDKDICKKWVWKLISLKATDVTVKKNRNSFFKYFLQVLLRCAQGGDQVDMSDLAEKTADTTDFMCRWSTDKRTYIAAKALPGIGTLVYMAVSRDISLGWERQGERISV